MEILNRKTDNGQTIYNNKTLTSDLQQPAKENNPLSTNNKKKTKNKTPGSQPASQTDSQESQLGS